LDRTKKDIRCVDPFAWRITILDLVWAGSHIAVTCRFRIGRGRRTTRCI